MKNPKENNIMKKKIGFIDLFIDEWHANNYPRWIRESALKDEFDVAMAWEKYTPEGKRNLIRWCEEQQVTPAKSIEEVIENCDCLCVLAPSNPEVHEELAELPLKSGKPVYVDKPFAPNRAAAERMFELSAKYNSPLMSSSALRYGDELMELQQKNIGPVFVSTCGGGGNFPEYAIHQIEMIVSLMGIGAKELQVCGNPKAMTVAVRYDDGRLASMNYAPHWGFTLNASSVDNGGAQLNTLSNIFPNLLQKILEFYKSGVNTIPAEQTIEIAGILDAVVRGMAQYGSWIKIG